MCALVTGVQTCALPISAFSAFPASGRSMVRISAAPIRSARNGSVTSQLLTFDEMHQHPAEDARMQEADQRAARARPADLVDHAMPAGSQPRQRTVDVGRLQRDVVQPGAALFDEAGDGALVLLRRARPAVLDRDAGARIEVLQELQLAVR